MHGNRVLIIPTPPELSHFLVANGIDQHKIIVGRFIESIFSYSEIVFTSEGFNNNLKNDIITSFISELYKENIFTYDQQSLDTTASALNMNINGFIQPLDLFVSNLNKLVDALAICFIEYIVVYDIFGIIKYITDFNEYNIIIEAYILF